MKKAHKVIKFNQNAGLEPYIDMNTDLKKEAKMISGKLFFKLMNNVVFEKTMEITTKHRPIKLAITERRRNSLVSEPNYHTTKFFTENLLADILTNQRACLGFSILELSKILMYELSCYYVKLKYGEKVKLCYMERNCLHCIQFHCIHKKR